MYMLCLQLVLLAGAREANASDGAKTTFIYADYGDSVTLQCFYPSSISHLSWYKQPVGEKPQLISHYYKHTTNVFYNMFEDSQRFSVETGAKGVYHLNISNVQESDSALYFCGRSYVSKTEFDHGTFLVFKESSSRSYLQQPVSASVQQGDSVTLNCTVYTKACDGDHNVYWFRHRSEYSQLGILYTHRDKNGPCVKSDKATSLPLSCVYSLSKSNISVSDAGMYYCAVASCGEIMLGEGTQVNVEGYHGYVNVSRVLMYCLGVTLFGSFILIIVLACILYKTTKRLHCRGIQPQLSSSPSDGDNQGRYNMLYAALSFNRAAHTAPKTRRQRRTKEETIYSTVRQQNQE